MGLGEFKCAVYLSQCQVAVESSLLELMAWVGLYYMFATQVSIMLPNILFLSINQSFPHKKFHKAKLILTSVFLILSNFILWWWPLVNIHLCLILLRSCEGHFCVSLFIVSSCSSCKPWLLELPSSCLLTCCPSPTGMSTSSGRSTAPYASVFIVFCAFTLSS